MTLCYAHKKEDPFVRLDKRIVMDSSISWKAKGILAYAFSRPESWRFYRKEMMRHASDGPKAFDSGIKELEGAGYLHKCTAHEEDSGQFQGWEWHFFESPITNEEFEKLKNESSNSKKEYRNPHFSEYGKMANTPKGEPNKKECSSKNKKNNNNPPENAEVEPPKDATNVVVVFLKKLDENLSPRTIEILSHFSLEQVEQAVKAARQVENPTSFDAVLLQATREEWEPKPTPEEREAKNREYLEFMKEWDGKQFGSYQMQVLPEGIAFVPIKQDRTDNGANFKVTDTNFISNVKKFGKEAKKAPQPKETQQQKPTGQDFYIDKVANYQTATGEKIDRKKVANWVKNGVEIKILLDILKTAMAHDRNGKEYNLNELFDEEIKNHKT